MKYAFALFLLISSFLASAQLTDFDFAGAGYPDFPVDENTQMVSYSKVINVDGVSADELYELGLEWINTYFKNSSSVMQVKDKDNHHLEGKHSFYVMKDVKGNMVKGELIKYQFTIRFRDGRYKYEVTKINVQKAAYYGIEKWILGEDEMADEHVPYYLDQIHVFMTEDFLASLVEGIQPKKEIKEEEW